MPKYEVTYTLPYLHVVTVGVVARSEKDARKKTEKAFGEGSIWGDTVSMPLLYDSYDEEDGGLIFEAEKVEDFRPKDLSVRTLHFERAAESLVEALAADKNPGAGLRKYAKRAQELIKKRDGHGR